MYVRAVFLCNSWVHKKRFDMLLLLQLLYGNFLHNNFCALFGYVLLQHRRCSIFTGHNKAKAQQQSATLGTLNQPFFVDFKKLDVRGRC